MKEQSKTEAYFMRMAGTLYRSAYNEGHAKGIEDAKEKYGKSKGIAHVTMATTVQRRENRGLWGWCDCGNPIEGRWVRCANYCPWCGKVIEWEKKKESEVTNESV